MLERLAIEGLALVDRIEIEFSPGLNVVTGETGTGKSLLVQSVNLLVGERADVSSVREGAKAAVVEGEFRLDGGVARRVAELFAEWELDFDGETVIVRREVQASGKSRATINQSPVTLASLKRLGEMVADLHGQHEHQSLLRADAGLEVLDRLGELNAERAGYAEALQIWRDARETLERLDASLATFADRRAWMSEAAREIDEAHLIAGEEEDLKHEAARLAHADRLRELVAQALDALSDGEHAAVDSLASASQRIEQAAALDPTLGELRASLEEARVAADDAGRTLARYASTLEADPRALEEIESRRETLSRLTRKYRRDVSDLILWRAELSNEIATGEDAEGALARAREVLGAAERACVKSGKALSLARASAAKEWSTRLTRELKPLGMSHARLEFTVEPIAAGEGGFRANGLDHVEMRFSANPGESARPLQRIASGGELSRVMLALKAALEAQDRVDVLIFDEVDSGIGGAVAQAVGERLRRLARHRQIVCVTHLPMIAALATRHLRATKHVSGGRTVVRIEALEAESRVDELARMLAGDRVTDTTRRQARELLAERPAGSAAS